jgi:UDP-N-acetylglucosamine--N-acetylmuramyl-(pentapeptide) pyrophosphoryl-undecaprenol N-acetylglucosamine transferase
MTKLKRILIMAGGTGGHVFPGLAAADYFRKQGVDVHWLGTSKGLEARVVPAKDIPLHLVDIGGVRGKGKKTLLQAPFRIFKAIRQSSRIIKDINPDVVIGMGGFVSGPGGVAAWLRKKPLVIHEQNARAGMTNKILSRFARRVLQGFPGAFKENSKVVTIGNPVRADIESVPAPDQRIPQDRKPFRLLVLGGSLGAKAINDLLPKTLASIEAGGRPEIFHQTGERSFEETKTAYETMGIKATVVPFVEDMAQAYSWADMVICRAGALTVAELCAVGLGAVFVPFPFAVDDHQTENARFMVKKDAALCVQQKDLTQGLLTDIVEQFALAPDKRLAMAKAAYQLRKVHVPEKIFNICEEISR